MNQSNQDNNNPTTSSEGSNIRALLIAGSFVVMLVGIIIYEITTKK